MLGLRDAISVPLVMKKVDFAHRPPSVQRWDPSRMPTLDCLWGDLLACSIMVGHRSLQEMQRHGAFSMADSLRRMHVITAILEEVPSNPGRLQHSGLYRDADLSEHSYFSYCLGMAASLLVAQERFGRPFLQHYDAATGTTQGKRPDLISPPLPRPRLIVEAKGTRGAHADASKQMKSGHSQVDAVLARPQSAAVIVSSFSRRVNHGTQSVGEWGLHVHHNRQRMTFRSSRTSTSRQAVWEWLMAATRRADPFTLVSAFAGLASQVADAALALSLNTASYGDVGYLAFRDSVSGLWVGLEESTFVQTLDAARDLEVSLPDKFDVAEAVARSRQRRDPVAIAELGLVRGPVALWDGSID